MLKQRVITALVLAPIFFCVIYFLPTYAVATVLGIVVMIAAWEWASLSGLKLAKESISYSVLMGVVLCFSFPLISSMGKFIPFLLLVCLWWFFILCVIVYSQKNNQLPAKNRRLLLLSGFPVLVPAWICLIYLHGHSSLGPSWVFLLLGIIWCADIGAYFTGRVWGVSKLADKISPGKSWQGLIGGLLTVVILALIGLPLLLDTWSIPPSMLVLCLFTAGISLLGDLWESLVKRIAGKKDSGTLLPGHGGVMDRIDSLTAAAPIFTIGLIFSGVIQ